MRPAGASENLARRNRISISWTDRVGAHGPVDVGPHRAVRQAKGLLWAAEGAANEQIARRCRVDSDAVRRWRARFAESGPAGVGVIAKGRGRTPRLPEGTVAEVVRVTRHESPDDGATHWTTRSLAAMFAGSSCLDGADGQYGWCEDALARMPFPCSPELLNALSRLHAVNSRQWDAEDRVRRAGDGKIPAIKREIDELNSLRHVLIEQVDRILEAGWAVNEDVPPLTEPIGSALDRLSVSTLRIAHAERLVDDSAGAAERVAILRRQRDDLVWSIAVACEDLVSGRRRAPRPERMKLYGESGR